MRFFYAAIVIIALALLYIRFAPSDAARWHVDPQGAADPGRGGVVLRVSLADSPRQALARFDRVARSAPRITVLAGSIEAGHITYVARSKWLGFPDYITVKALAAGAKSELVILSRLRFGQSDLGVNRARLENWLEALQPAQN